MAVGKAVGSVGKQKRVDVIISVTSWMFAVFKVVRQEPSWHAAAPCVNDFHARLPSSVICTRACYTFLPLMRVYVKSDESRLRSTVINEGVTCNEF